MSIEVKNVSKTFGKTRALDNVSVTFGDNKIYGLLGNNGAGKSTLLNIITGKIFPNDGTVTIDGKVAFDNDEMLSKTYMMGDKNYFPDTMRVREAFRVTKAFYPEFDTELCNELVKRFKLNTRSKITALSTGYASIFRLIVALCVNTPYVILDEPVLGLDAQHRDMFYKLLLECYSKKPRTIIISTHLISEVQNLIEHTVMICDGRIIKDMPCYELLMGGYTVSGPAALVDRYIAEHKPVTVETIGGLKSATITGTAEDVPEGLEVGSLDLQSYFIDLMNGEEAK